MQTTTVNVRELRAALARQGMPQWKLAATLDVSPSTLSAYLHGHPGAPANLRQRIEAALGLDDGALAHRHNSSATVEREKRSTP